MSDSTNDQRAGTPRPEFTRRTDLASRLLGGSVVAANDEAFAERENLIKAQPPTYQTFTFGHKGQVYDGWETRRRREPGSDWAIVRLGIPGLISGVVVDTAFFRGNYPPEISVEGAGVEGYPSPAELADTEWFPLVPRSAAAGDTENFYGVDCPWRVTHVRLNMHPDGGIARLRVHGDAVTDPRFLADGAVDLVALENGGTVTDCSNTFFSSPTNLIAPGESRVMGEGWETARRRDHGNDYIEFDLAAAGRVQVVELDTRYFVHNAPGWARLTGHDPGQGGGWVEVLPRTRLQPDTRHRFRVPETPELTHVRLDVYPDGGMSRVRLWGSLADRGMEDLRRRWLSVLPPGQARVVQGLPAP